ncbi:phage major capsid protein [Nocardioides pinisoli]|uniref:Phage major capsid protein n=1 Tax=Nocardioides pinisoli TaxID=2950279 RepID=A0ABT1KY98_9ACTN|nr:phage major capsid protein [Nocardioides pinisoli]MCP3422731.1 phage major capsid protein [Nocardioides pinisoli]
MTIKIDSLEAARRLSVNERNERVRAIADELERLLGHDKMTRSQEERFDELKFESQCIARANGYDEVLAAADSGRVEPGSHGDDDVRTSRGRDEASRTIDAAVRSGLLADHAAEKAQHLVDHGRQHERSLAAKWAVATGSPAYLTAFAKVCADPVRGHMMWDERERAAYQRVEEVQSEFRAMSLTDANGGYMVPLTLDPAINLTNAGSINPLRQVARVVQTATESWTGITSAGATAEWKAEAAQAADGSPTIDDQPIPVHFGDVFVPYSFEVGMDAARFTEELSVVLRDAADQLQATAFTTGSGTGQPKGFVTALTGTSSEVNAAADDTFARGDVYNLQNQLPARFQANAAWVASLPIINTIGQFESAAGSRVFASVDDGRLLNRPLYECSNMDSTVTTSGATSNMILAYGDWKQFVIVDRIGTTLELVPHLFGANGRPTGQRGAFLWFRTGSDVLVTNAFRMLDVASAA